MNERELKRLTDRTHMDLKMNPKKAIAILYMYLRYIQNVTNLKWLKTKPKLSFKYLYDSGSNKRSFNISVEIVKGQYNIRLENWSSKQEFISRDGYLEGRHLLSIIHKLLWKLYQLP